MGKSICIVCEKEKKGVPIKIDRVIRLIRSVKRKFNVAQDNDLYVCKECWPKYKDKRKKFERSIMVWGAVAAIISILLIGTSLFNLGFTDLFLLAKNIFLSLIVFVVFIFMIGLGYVPGTEYDIDEKGNKIVGSGSKSSVSNVISKVFGNAYSKKITKPVLKKKSKPPKKSKVKSKGKVKSKSKAKRKK